MTIIQTLSMEVRGRSTAVSSSSAETTRRQWQAIEVYSMTNVQLWRVEIAAAKIPADVVYAGALREIQAGQ